ncbi:MerR family transcriptional regulator [Photobacterium sp. DNB23_23_1]|uniref:MerR family transcriptional regulator n=1 Tax=Photobacterium pectinilyticum TaxID=2906793 RepID=A0ABT1MZR7_9GAMM|nr:MerR family transcriptional regulator [Photobacterium sp. ZSDE20]MCQ1057970.1 MerR family transcriptional regulator [Photobacterium sp. ZSDE20]MDD1822502.1 MerR family transcriptional regulator [Photobacterium sp. ZSDE20]
MYIGEAAKKSGASERAIRLYESMGLLRVSRAGKYRVFSEADIEFIRLIKEGQSLGLHLSELKELVDGEQDFNWTKVLQLLEEKQQSIASQIKMLEVQYLRIGEYRQAIDQCNY